MYPRKLLTVMATLALLVLMLAACGGTATPAAAPTNTPQPAPTVAPTDTPQPTPTAAPTETPQPTATSTAQPEPTLAPTVAAEPEPAAAPLPVNAIVGSFVDQPQAAGDVVILYGQVLDVNGSPQEGVAVEIWQTDANGIYDHPNDPSTANRDRSFQFYGTSVTDADGYYAFRTIRPGHYEPRPSHFHVKVRVDGQEVLTTQFYFEDERDALANEGLFLQAGDRGDMLILSLEKITDASGNPILLARNDLVIDTGLGSGSLALTPSQTEGPYYPVVTVADYDNDLTIVP